LHTRRRHRLLCPAQTTPQKTINEQQQSCMNQLCCFVISFGTP
jgi:hypothetical protein